MPVHNGERHLVEALESILLQDLTDFEFLVVDDGSTDGSGRILHDFAARDSRLVILRHDRNMGLTASLNAGLTHARAPFVARMDADDRSRPARLRLQLDYMNTHPECVAVGCQVLAIDDDGDPLSNSDRPVTHDAIVRAFVEQFGGAIAHPAAMFRLDAVNSIGGYDESYDSAQDLDLFLRLAAVGKLANLDAVLFDYRVSTASVSGSRRARQVANAVRILNRHSSALGYVAPKSAPPGALSTSSAGLLHRGCAESALRGDHLSTAWKHLRVAIRLEPGSPRVWLTCARFARKLAGWRGRSEHRSGEVAWGPKERA